MDFIRSMVKGRTWKARMSNGDIFEIWTPFELKRKQAIQKLLDFANGDYEIYDRGDVESVWSVAG